MKVLDTTFLIDLANGVEETKLYLSQENLFTTQINLFEFVRGLYLRKMPQHKHLELQELFDLIRVLPLDDFGILKSAEISATLFRNGMPIDDGDCLTAGIALSKGITTIVTRNVDHFKRIKEVNVEQY